MKRLIERYESLRTSESERSELLADEGEQMFVVAGEHLYKKIVFASCEMTFHYFGDGLEALEKFIGIGRMIEHEAHIRTCDATYFGGIHHALVAFNHAKCRKTLYTLMDSSSRHACLACYFKKGFSRIVAKHS